MATEIKIPIPDQVTEEVRIVKWHSQEGDTVKKGDVLLEVETDKSVIEVESAGDGVILQRQAKENDNVPVGAVVGMVGEAGESAAGAAPAAQQQAQAGGSPAPASSSVATAPPANRGPIKASPIAMKLADKLGVDIAQVTGSGPNGRIVRDDVEAFAKGGAPAPAGEAPAPAPDAPARAEQPASPDFSVPAWAQDDNAAKSSGPVTEVKIPIPDQVTEEVRIVKWHKQQGDDVKKGDVVLEVETDKSVIEVEAAGAGVLLKALAAENDNVPVGKVVGAIGAPGTVYEAACEGGAAAAPAATEQAAAQAAPASTASATEVAAGRVKASPNARRLAAELGVDLTAVTATGADGRITGDDVQQAAAGGGATAAPATAAKSPAMAASPGEPPKPGTEVAVSRMRNAIGRNLQASSRDIPHFNVTISVDMTHALTFRKQLNQGREKANRVSVNDLVVRAVAMALVEFPEVNSRFTGETIQYHKDINIGVATAVPDGLVVPVVTEVDKRSWDNLQAETKRVATEARGGKIINAGKGTFTVSNLGMFGVEQFTAIINPPESAILAVGGTQETVVVVDGQMVIKPMMKVTLCSDHRIIDGALAAQFLKCFKLYMEKGLE